MIDDATKRDDLRNRAEELLSKPDSQAENFTLEEVKALVHDLRVHQVELELQNEELRRTQKELQRLTDKYSRLYNNAPAGYLTVEQTGRILQANDTFGKMVGMEPYQLLNTSLFDLIHEQDRSEVISRFRAFYKNPADKHIETRMTNGRSGIFHANLRGNIDRSLHYGRDEIGEADQLLLIISDISLKREADLQLRKQKDFLQTILNGIMDIIALLKIDHTIISFNKAGYEFWGLPPSQVDGRKCFGLVGRDEPCDECAAIKALKSGYPETIEKYFPEVGRWFQVRAIPVYDNEKRVSMIVEQLQDIHDRKIAEKERRKLGRELHQAQKMEAIGTLAGGIAHDFNNLLQAINGYTQIILMGKDERHQDYKNLTGVLNAGNRAAELVQQMLLFSRKVEADRVPVEINREIEQAVSLLVRTIPKMIDIEVHAGENLWLVMADSVQLEQVLLNLGSNAADAMPDGGRMVIESRNIEVDEACARELFGVTPGRYVLVTVTDNGQGMDKTVKDHIFEPFFTTKEIGKGTGLGLASVYGIVKGHGGFINCYSEVGQGTVFKIYLPAIARSEEQWGEDAVRGIPEGGRETILLVDDEEAIRDFAAQLLEKFGYTVEKAANGEEAIEQYSRRSDEIDLVILDIGMPGMGGHRCLKEILRKDPTAKILVSSGYSMNRMVKDSLQSGAIGFIGKPYQMVELLDRIRRVFDTGPELDWD